jgi:hypothetical protein
MSDHDGSAIQQPAGLPTLFCLLCEKGRGTGELTNCAGGDAVQNVDGSRFALFCSILIPIAEGIGAH